jgi:hypothetical protein
MSLNERMKFGHREQETDMGRLMPRTIGFRRRHSLETSGAHEKAGLVRSILVLLSNTSPQIFAALQGPKFETCVPDVNVFETNAENINLKG